MKDKYMISEKMTLMWADIKSWAWTSLIFAFPFGVSALMEYLGHFDLGKWGILLSLVLGALLKLAQKWSKITVYKI